MQQDLAGYNALMWATQGGYTAIVHAILESPHCDTEVLMQKIKDGNTLLNWIKQNGYTGSDKIKHYYTALANKTTDENLKKTIEYAKHIKDDHLQRLCESRLYSSKPAKEAVIETLNMWKKRQPDPNILALALVPYQQFSCHFLALFKDTRAKLHKPAIFTRAIHSSTHNDLCQILTPEEKTSIFDHAIQSKDHWIVETIVAQVDIWKTNHIKSLQAMAQKNWRLCQTIIQKRTTHFLPIRLFKNVLFFINSPTLIISFLSSGELTQLASTSKSMIAFHIPTHIQQYDATRQNDHASNGKALLESEHYDTQVKNTAMRQAKEKSLAFVNPPKILAEDPKIPPRMTKK